MTVQSGMGAGGGGGGSTGAGVVTGHIGLEEAKSLSFGVHL